MSVGKTVSTSMFIMWCKKCWKYLDYAYIKCESKSAMKKKHSFKGSKSPEQEAIDEFAEFYIFAHEFLCLAANSISRSNIVESIFQPNFELRKIECGFTKDQIK
jgi:hypothetical protein